MAWSVLLDRPEDYTVYMEHPLHQEIIRTGASLKKAINALDFDFPQPATPAYTLVVGTKNYSRGRCGMACAAAYGRARAL